MSVQKIGLLVGSLRAASYSRKVALEMIRLAASGMKLELIEIGDLPLYNEDLEQQVPPSWHRFREAMREKDGIIFVTPEYNRSVPGLLKNAIDVGSRPYGKSVWNGKPGAVVSVTPGGLGAFGANHHLRQSMVFLNVPMMQQPEAYLSNIAACFDAAQPEAGARLEKFLDGFLKAYSEWVSGTLGNDK
ncbi:NADPH-dependent FMN reductase [Niabella beijingensis]|uniref:NADPH-dependent FMN reductase n=1 Tax=Niabella beijingensis TaxID=2872700 RepID=UPI0023E38240|nr:NAD(P)H-dependent oxidoreductase [Niabella beijingensis]MBZ4191670.1 NAD(P)H-dependent oxidoreductase [Niabella beijingensis]